MTGILVPVSGSVESAGSFFCGMEEDAEGGGIGRGVDAGGGIFAVLLGWMERDARGRCIGPGVDAGGDVFGVLRGGCG